MSQRAKKSQRAVIETLLKNIENKYLTREKMYNRILYNRGQSDTGVIDIVNRIDTIDAVRENVNTSLQFGNYRRAMWYLTLLVRLCEKYL